MPKHVQQQKKKHMARYHVVLATLLLFYFEQIFLLANSEDPDRTPCSAASDLGLHCLPMSQKWDARLK